MTIATIQEHPILFNTGMVKAILDGRKTQTRRVVKPQPDEDGLARNILLGEYQDTSEKVYRSKYGEAGHHLWVRESYRFADSYDEMNPAWAGVEMGIEEGEEPSHLVDHKGEDTKFPYGTGGWGRWRSPIHMPRWASRIDLLVKFVRVERLQDISEEDARAEGIEYRHGYYLGGIHPIKGTLKCWPTAKEAFIKLWQSIHRGKPGRCWASNPWVWVIEFEVINP